MMAIEGVDYSYDHPSPIGLGARGKKFAVRYVGPGRASKMLTASEAKTLEAYGVRVVCVAEGFANGLSGGWTEGERWATLAQAHATRLGMPAGRPIYFACDFDVQATGWYRVANALRGAASVIGRDRVGIYGSFDAVAWAFRDGVACWAWQTYAWSGGRIHSWTHAYQYLNGVPMDGGTVDLDQAFVSDYGWWTPAGGTLASEPMPAPGSRTLRLSDPMTRGADVGFVQRHIGPYRCGRSDGVLGPQTDSGIRWYQARRGLRVDGIVGPRTWAAMGVTYAPPG